MSREPLRDPHMKRAPKKSEVRVLSTIYRIRRAVDRRAWRALQLLRARLPRRPPPVILNYHRIAEESFDPWGLAVTPAHLREQLSWLAQNRTVIRLADFAELHARQALPADAVAVTFDDGYACNGLVAAPLLREFQVPATFFLPTDLVDKRATFWWDELEEIVLEHDGPSLIVDGRAISLGKRDSTDRLWPPGTAPRTPRQQVYSWVQSQLARKTPFELAAVIAELHGQVKQLTLSPKMKRPMTINEIREAGLSGVEFGSHTLNHPWLPSLDPAEKRREIVDSAERCCILSGSPALTFAYPFGAFDPQAELLAKEAGYGCACTTGDLAVSRRSCTFALPRLRVGDWGKAAFQRALTRVCAA